MSSSIQEAVCYACITHVPLAVTYPSYVKPILLGAAQVTCEQTPGGLNLRDLAPQWEPYHRHHLGGSAGTFALRHYLLKQQPQVRFVGICTYRKFLTKQRIATPEQNGLALDMIPRAALDAALLDDAMMPGQDGFLVCKPALFMRADESITYLDQYEDEEPLKVEDFLRFTAMAVELGVLSQKEASRFLHEKIFFIGGVELGVYPVEFWMQTVGALEAVTWSCVQQYKTLREGLRFWSMCLERLGSYLLLKHFLNIFNGRDWPNFCTGYLNVVSDDNVFRNNHGFGGL